MLPKRLIPIPLAVALIAASLCPGQELGSTMTLDQVQQKQRENAQPSFAPFNVQPAPEPSPALQYRLWMPAYTLKPGSAQTHFYRAALALNEVPNETLNRLIEWADRSESEIPLDELQPLLEHCAVVFAELRALAQSEDTNWDLRVRDLNGTDAYRILLPDVQIARTLARLIICKARAEIKQLDWNAATETLRDGFRLGSFVGQGELLVSQMVGLAIRETMLACVSELIQTPDAPNMYWALATLPRSSGDLTEAIQFETTMALRIFPLLEEAEHENETQEYWVSRWEENVATLEDFYSDPKLSLQLMLAAATSEKIAKNRLLAQRFSPDEIDSMPPMRIVLIDAARQLRRETDNLIKGTLLPDEVGRSLTADASQANQKWMRDSSLELASVILSVAQPAVRAFKDAETREMFILNRLMTIEAIRMHAAAHDGRLPANLSELQPVPALPNAFTGEPFGYELIIEGGKQQVILTADAPSYLSFNETRITITN